MFPVSRTDDQPTTAKMNNDQIKEQITDDGVTTKVRRMQSALVVRKAVPERSGDSSTPIRRPGSQYKHYRKEEDLPPNARAFYKAAGKMVALSVPSLVTSVFQVECKLQAWLREHRKREYFASMRAKEAAGADSNDAGSSVDSGDEDSIVASDESN